MFDIFLHGDVFWLPVVVLHGLIQIIRPLVFEREDIEEHRFTTVDHFFCGKSLFSLCFIEHEGAVSECDSGVNGHGLKGKNGSKKKASDKRSVVDIAENRDEGQLDFAHFVSTNY